MYLKSKNNAKVNSVDLHDKSTKRLGSIGYTYAAVYGFDLASV
jgi:hypothetical protein